MRCVYVVFAVCYQCGAETLTTWMEDEFWLALLPFLIHSHSSMLCGCLLSLKYRCDLRTKASVCSVISSPKLIFLIAVCCVLFVLNMSGFLRKAPHALFETTKSMKKYDKRLFGTRVVACWQFMVGSGLRLIEVFGRHRVGGVLFCPPLISCKESWRKNKGWTVRNNVVLSRAQLIVLILLLPACHVAPSCMNGVDCVKMTEISFHIPIMYLEYSSVYVNKFTLLKAVTEGFVSKHSLYLKYLVISCRFCWLSVLSLHFFKFAVNTAANESHNIKIAFDLRSISLMLFCLCRQVLQEVWGGVVEVEVIRNYRGEHLWNLRPETCLMCLSAADKYAVWTCKVKLPLLPLCSRFNTSRLQVCGCTCLDFHSFKCWTFFTHPMEDRVY